MLRENFNQTSKRRHFFGNLVVPSRRPFSEKILLKNRQLYHRKAPFLYHRTARPCRTECSRIPKKLLRNNFWPSWIQWAYFWKVWSTWIFPRDLLVFIEYKVYMRKTRLYRRVWQIGWKKNLYVSTVPFVYICVGPLCNFYFEKHFFANFKSRNSVLKSTNSSKIRARRSGSEKPLESCSMG